MGMINPTGSADKFHVENGVAYFDAAEDNSPLVQHRLYEYEPGLFIADNGEALDFRSSTPTWRNLDLIRVNGGPLPWQWLLVALTGLVALTWFVLTVWSVVRRRRRAPSSEVGEPLVRRLMSVLASLTALVALIVGAVLVIVPGIVDSGFLGGLQGPTALRLVFHLPLLLATLAACMLVFAAIAVPRRWYTLEFRVRYLAVTVAVVLLAIQLVAWHLVGLALS